MNKPTLVPSRDAVTNFQVATILGIINTTGQFLVQPDIDAANPHKPGGSMDGGARTSAELTFCKACERLDTILADTARWDLELQRLLELHTVKLMNEQMLFLRAQTKASEALATPAYMHQPTIINAGDGNFVALLGDPEAPACLGVGRSPEEACRDFDKSFTGGVTASQLQWLKEYLDKPTPGQTDTKNQKRKKK